MRVYKKNGVIIELDKVRLCLDGSFKCDLGFISHAHTDHLVWKKVNHSFIMSKETKALSEHRTRIKHKHYNKSCFKGLKFKMLDNGHVFGSRALLIQGSEKVLYTSDFTTRDRFFLKGFKPVKCDTLIIETTYGNPTYNFPSTKQVFKQANDYITDELSKGNSLVLNAYALGKAQLISKLVQDYDAVWADSRIARINELCNHYGAKLLLFKTGRVKGQFILISPNRRPNLKAKSVGFTGWGLNYFNGFDECFPLSDHCDFRELLKVVKKCSPSKVYTHHGFSSEFAELLRLEGFDARPI